MKFKEQLKQKFSVRCDKCGYQANHTLGGSFSSWFFHEQLCACENSSPAAQLGLAPLTKISENVENSAQMDQQTKFDPGDQYEIQTIIGKGGMGNVYKALDKTDGTTVAIKVLRPDLAKDKTVIKRFEQEALAVEYLNHPNLVWTKKLGHTNDNTPYIVMEYIDGISLSDLIKQRGHLSVSETIKIISQTTEAIAYAHAQGIIHRDIKPSNILLSEFADDMSVKVVDFGIAKAISEKQIGSSNLTQTGDIVGSPAYMSPEQCLGDQIDERSDIYSLGCVMYEMLTGKSPFAAANPVQSILKHIEKDAEPFAVEFYEFRIPDAVEEIVLKCLQKDPVLRYQTVADLEKCLQNPVCQPVGVGKRLSATGIDVLLILCLLPLSSNWAYNIPWSGDLNLAIAFSIFVCSPGKWFTKLKVLDKTGRPIGLIESAIHILTIWAFCMTIFCVDVSVRLQMIHHKYIDFNPSLTAWIFLGIFIAADWLILTFSANRQSLLDRLFDCVVTQQNIPFAESISTRSSRKRIPWAIGLLTVAILIMFPLITDKLAGRAHRQNLIKLYPIAKAVKNIPKGTVITQEMVTYDQESVFLVHSHKWDPIYGGEDILGRAAKFPISAGDPISGHDLEPYDYTKPYDYTRETHPPYLE